LRPLTYAIPKPLIPIGERPILETIISRLRAYGITDIVIATGYRAELIETYFRDGSQFRVKIRYLQEERPLGTAGPLAYLGTLGRDVRSFLLMNGDILTRLNVPRMLKAHEKSQADVTVGVKKHTYRLPYGVVERADRRIVRVREKPTLRFDVVAGIYVLRPQVIDLVAPGERLDMPDLIRRVIRRGGVVGYYPIREFWLAVDGLSQVEEALAKRRRWDW